MRKTLVTLGMTAMLSVGASPALAGQTLFANPPVLSGGPGGRIISTGYYKGSFFWGERTLIECKMKKLVTRSDGSKRWVDHYPPNGRSTSSTGTKCAMTGTATPGEFRTAVRKIRVQSTGGVIKSPWVQSPKVVINGGSNW